MPDIETPNPAMWSDFDGTAVQTVGLLNPRNWVKYPLDGVPSYDEFLEGVQEEGMDIGGIVSRRPDIFPRRLVTARSIQDLDLERFFSQPGQVVLTGDEASKGAFLVNEAQKGAPLGMIDDKPHHIGHALVDALRETPLGVQTPQISLGVVSHSRSEEHMMRFIKEVRTKRAETRLFVTEKTNDHSFALRSHDYRFRLNVFRLPRYSREAGKAFAGRVLSAVSD